MTNSPTSKLIAETLALAEKATPGPWYEDHNHISSDEDIISDYVGDGKNRVFIAHSRTAAPKLAEMLQVACEALERIRNPPAMEGHGYEGPEWCSREALAQIDAIAAGERKEE